MILLAPSGPISASWQSPRRVKAWSAVFSSLGKLVPVSMHTSSSGTTAVAQCLEHMLAAVRSKAQELKAAHPTRPIVLVGWEFGALVAAHTALATPVAALVC